MVTTFPVSFWLIVTGFLHEVLADLPIHCTLRDAAGDWVFQVGPAQKVQGRVPACGHHIPNAISTALKINHSEVVPNKTAKKVTVQLTEDIESKPQRHLVAKVDGDKGMWTMVFDTGLEIRVGDHSYFSHFLFEELPNATRPAKDGDNFKNIKQYIGRHKGKMLAPMGETYACYCDMLTTGFWHKRDKKTGQVIEYGCLWGAKKDSYALTGLTSFAVHSAQEVSEDFEAHGDMVKEVVPIRAPAPIPAGKKIAPDSRRRPASARSNASMPKRIALRGVASHNFEREASDVAELPENFDWRTQLQGMVPPGKDPLGEQVDQGPCGSCYAFAGVLMLQMRYRVQLFKRHKILYPLELSYKSGARCSPYTEGCNGGFSYLTMRLAAEMGMPEASCDKDVAAGALDNSCDWKCYKNNTQLFFAKDYWHIGGFSHGSDEKSIMREIYHNGPVELGFSTSAIPEFVARSGQSVSNSTDTMTIILNDRAPKEPFSTNSKIQKWTFSTHAILGVGWGQETVSWGMVKFWVVRNSWGRDWGDQGYAKMRRGNNDGGIETDATMVIPDLDRLPAGFLDKAKAYDAGMTKTRAQWAAMGPAGKHVVAKKGKPDYCKERPNSIDCQ